MKSKALCSVLNAENVFLHQLHLMCQYRETCSVIIRGTKLIGIVVGNAVFQGASINGGIPCLIYKLLKNY